MLATDKQINYLVYLAEQIEILRDKYPQQPINIPYINWQKERYKGVTITDANIRIKAYKQIICYTKLSINLLGV